MNMVHSFFLGFDSISYKTLILTCQNDSLEKIQLTINIKILPLNVKASPLELIIICNNVSSLIQDYLPMIWSAN